MGDSFTIENELVEKRGLTEAKTYTHFGRKYLREVNKRSEKWLKKQSFVKKAPNPRYVSMKISGNSKDSHANHL